MATVKQLIDEALYRLNEPIYASYIGSSGPAERQYLSLLKFIGDNLRNRPFNWPQLKREYSFLTVSGQSKYQLPGDFYRLLTSTPYDVTNMWPLDGPISDFNFAVRKYGITSLDDRKAFRIIGPKDFLYSTSPYSQRSAGYFEIQPSNDTGDTLTFQYLSSSWVWPQDWIASTSYSTGDIRAGVGQMYRCTAGGTSGATRPDWQTGSSSDGTLTWSVYSEPYTWLSDSDLVLLDEDVMIEGLRWAFLRAKGRDFTEERAEWENMVRSGFARFNGPARINAGDEYSISVDWPNVPAGSWSV